jgi:hypothetical protein
MNLDHITDENASVTCMLNDEVIDCASEMSIDAQSGEAQVKVIVTSEDESTTRTYILNLSRAKSSDAEIKTLVVKDLDDNEIQWNETNGAYQTVVSASTNAVNIIVEPNSPYAVVYSVEYNLNGNNFIQNMDHTYTIPIEDIGYEYNHGMNIVVICVMAENGDKKYHTVVLNKELNDDITLKSFKIDGTENVEGFENTATNLYEYRYTTVDYEKTHIILASGDFVLGVSEGTFGGKKTTYYDLFRIENKKIAEHWDVMEELLPQEQWKNNNGKF